MRSVILGVALALILVPLAGCLGAEDALQADGSLPAGSKGNGDDAALSTGRLEGRVVTAELDPIQGAWVRVSQEGALLAQASTDEQGRYAIEDLAPAGYLVQVGAPCCKEQIFRINVAAGETFTLNALMEELQIVHPYVLEFEWTGFIGCAARIPFYGSPDPEECQALDSNTETRVEFVIEPGLQTVVVAMVWDKVTTSAVEDLRLMMYRHPNTAERNRFFFEGGTSPLEVRHGPGDAIGGDALDFTTMEKPWDVRFRVWPGGTANVVYQQPFTVHYHLYYGDPAPENASAVPLG